LKDWLAKQRSEVVGAVAVMVAAVVVVVVVVKAATTDRGILGAYVEEFRTAINNHDKETGSQTR